ncbi:MAG: L-rhamnose mutarotase [Bacteroidaceae bacterium]
MENPSTGYASKRYDQPTKRYCQTLDLKENPDFIAEYRRLHSKEGAWKEILAGIREVGILEMEIYILGTRLFMIIDTPIDFDWNAEMDRLGKLPRQEAWEAVVAKFQVADPKAGSSEKWKQMERMFYLY